MHCHSIKGELVTGETRLHLTMTQKLTLLKNSKSALHYIGLTSLTGESDYESYKNNVTARRLAYRWTNGAYRANTSHFDKGTDPFT